MKGFSGQGSGSVQVLTLNPSSLSDILADIIRVGEAAAAIEVMKAPVKATNQFLRLIRSAFWTLTP